MDHKLTTGVAQFNVAAVTRIKQSAVLHPDHPRCRDAGHWAVEHSSVVDDCLQVDVDSSSID